MQILQGTTPSLNIQVDAQSVSLTDVVDLELAFRQPSQESPTLYGIEDVTLDTEHNSISFTFTQEMTMKLNPNQKLYWQLRLKLRDGNIVGTNKASIDVTDLMSEESI